MRRRAFTLVETLVCATIVAIVAGLVLSSIRSALGASRTTVCVSNLHQLATALNLYKGDAGEYPPSNERWAGLLPYLGDTPLHCPDRDAADPYGRPDLRIDYFVNGNGLTEDKTWEDCVGARGPSFPIAYDANHVSPYIARSAGRSFYIYARVDGSVAQVDFKRMTGFSSDPGMYPCPGTNQFYNFP